LCLQAETTLINFTVTEAGLEDQLLALVVDRERADLEAAKSALLAQNSEFVIKLKALEDGLLEKLSSAQGDLTENGGLAEHTTAAPAGASRPRVHGSAGGLANCFDLALDLHGCFPDVTEFPLARSMPFAAEALIVQLEESKALADEISEKVGGHGNAEQQGL
jgi:hypothetical protein